MLKKKIMISEVPGNTDRHLRDSDVIVCQTGKFYICREMFDRLAGGFAIFTTGLKRPTIFSSLAYAIASWV